MNADHKTRYVKDIPSDPASAQAKKPFRIETEDQRRFIRLEISAPMSLQKIRDAVGQCWPDGEWHIIHGMILNISAGGVLVELDQAVGEGDVVSMRFTLQEVEGVDHVLGLVKRVDIESEGCLAGIEFITRDRLTDYLSRAEMELLGDAYTNFDDSIRRVLDKYVYSSTLAGLGK